MDRYDAHAAGLFMGFASFWKSKRAVELDLERRGPRGYHQFAVIAIQFESPDGIDEFVKRLIFIDSETNIRIVARVATNDRDLIVGGICEVALPHMFRDQCISRQQQFPVAYSDCQRALIA